MVDARFTFLSRSMVARLMVPVALMLTLVCLLALVTVATRSRLRDAAAAVERQQAARLALVEARSLSRSLQRDALALLIEDDAGERRLIRAKFADRSRQFGLALLSLERDPAITGDLRASYLRTQRFVMHRLDAVATLIEQRDRRRALDTFRHGVRPAERRASGRRIRHRRFASAPSHSLYPSIPR